MAHSFRDFPDSSDLCHASQQMDGRALSLRFARFDVSWTSHLQDPQFVESRKADELSYLDFFESLDLCHTSSIRWMTQICIGDFTVEIPDPMILMR
jgi:hypothetical protein